VEITEGTILPSDLGDPNWGAVEEVVIKGNFWKYLNLNRGDGEVRAKWDSWRGDRKRGEESGPRGVLLAK